MNIITAQHCKHYIETRSCVMYIEYNTQCQGQYYRFSKYNIVQEYGRLHVWCRSISHIPTTIYYPGGICVNDNSSSTEKRDVSKFREITRLVRIVLRMIERNSKRQIYKYKNHLSLKYLNHQKICANNLKKIMCLSSNINNLRDAIGNAVLSSTLIRLIHARNT